MRKKKINQIKEFKASIHWGCFLQHFGKSCSSGVVFSVSLWERWAILLHICIRLHWIIQVVLMQDHSRANCWYRRFPVVSLQDIWYCCLPIRSQEFMHAKARGGLFSHFYILKGNLFRCKNRNLNPILIQEEYIPWSSETWKIPSGNRCFM